MSGTDVAKDGAVETPGTTAASPNTFLTFIRIWLPFPLMLGAILVFQFQRGGLKRDPVKEDEAKVAFQGAGPELPALMASLAAEREAVQKGREDLEFAQRRILLEQGEISARQKEVENLLGRVEGQFGKMEGERTRMLTQLARVYETMKSSAAADILSALDVETSTEILRRMKEKKAAEIMAQLEPEAAGRISEAMLHARPE